MKIKGEEKITGKGRAAQNIEKAEGSAFHRGTGLEGV